LEAKESLPVMLELITPEIDQTLLMNESVDVLKVLEQKSNSFKLWFSKLAQCLTWCILCFLAWNVTRIAPIFDALLPSSYTG